MDWIEALVGWAKANDVLLWWLFAASCALFLLTPIVVAWGVTRLPPDYFTVRHRQPLATWRQYPTLRLALLVAKNLLGIVLVFAGVVMLLVPGQGLLTICVGLVLLDFPGKFQLECWLAMRQQVWRAINWLRKRAGREPLKRPQNEQPTRT